MNHNIDDFPMRSHPTPRAQPCDPFGMGNHGGGMSPSGFSDFNEDPFFHGGALASTEKRCAGSFFTPANF